MTKLLKTRYVFAAKIWAVCLLGLIGVSFSFSQEVSSSNTLSNTFPGEQWERVSDADSKGFSSEKLGDLREHLESLNTTGLVVAVDGQILFEYGNIKERFYVASVRKSILAMLYGNYVERGKIDLDKSLAEMDIDDHGGLSDQEREATTADLLSARSGVYHAASNSGDSLASAPERGSQKHGEYFLYSNWDFNALGTIFEQETGKNIYDALESDLVNPIGLQDFVRSQHRRSGDSKKSKHLAYHMVFSTRDMARLGHLMLHEGTWNKKQVVPKRWTRKISSVITPNSEMNPASIRDGRFGYGYLWWIFDGPQASGNWEGAYFGFGYGGQAITVIPKLKMVVAHKTNFGRNGNKFVGNGQYLRILEKIMDAKT